MEEDNVMANLEDVKSAAKVPDRIQWQERCQKEYRPLLGYQVNHKFESVLTECRVFSAKDLICVLK